MPCKFEKIGVDPITLSLDELCSVDIALYYTSHESISAATPLLPGPNTPLVRYFIVIANLWNRGYKFREQIFRKTDKIRLFLAFAVRRLTRRTRLVKPEKTSFLKDLRVRLLDGIYPGVAGHLGVYGEIRLKLQHIFTSFHRNSVTF